MPIVVGIIGRKVYGGCDDSCFMSIDGVEAEELFDLVCDLSRPRISGTMPPLWKKSQVGRPWAKVIDFPEQAKD